MASPFDRHDFVIQGHRFVEDIPGVSEQSWLWAISILATLYSVLILMIRGAIKWGCFGVCDWVLLAAYVRNLRQIVTRDVLTIPGRIFHHSDLPLGGTELGSGQDCWPCRWKEI